MVLQKYAEGKVVYHRLGYEGATRLMDTVADHIGSVWVGGSRGVPGNNAWKHQLMTALLQCIAQEGTGKYASAPASASASASAPASAPVPASLNPPAVPLIDWISPYYSC